VVGVTATPLAARSPERPAAGPALHWLRGWAALAHLVLDLVVAVPCLVLTVLLIVGVATVPAFGVGIVIVAAALAAARGVAVFERARILAFTGVRIPPAQAPPVPGWRRFLLEGRTWKAMAYVAAQSLWGLVAGSVALAAACLALALAALPLYRWALPHDTIALFGSDTAPAGLWWGLVGLAGLLVLPFAAAAIVRVEVLVAGALLGAGRPDRERVLTQRVETLTRTRVDTVDSVEAERRRIERDLHDGPQQRLVAIAMDLGMARERLARDPEGAQQLVDHAHAAAKEAITEMRQVARGIHPPVLTDRGLDAALSALAAGSPVPVHVSVHLPRRPSPTLEAIAYFCVSEALTNVAKHAGARQAWADVREADGLLTVTVRDDGRGGADLTRGTGLVGLRQRAAAVDGTLDVSSPPGGPTVVTVTLPFTPAAPENPERTAP
jgi:signal transduction histidine kinase